MATKRRSKVKHPGLKKGYNSKVKQEYMDQDYIPKLSNSEKDFLSDFNEEYYGANLDFQNLENNRFHKTKEEKKACTDRNNARNRCTYGVAKAGGKLDTKLQNDSDKPNPKYELSSDNPEDALIELIDFISENE
jgi:hypothetical protein